MKAPHPSVRSRHGFSLVEILVAAGLVLVLIVILLPYASGQLKTAKIAGATGGLRKISAAYLVTTMGDDARAVKVGTVHEFARDLAQYGGLNDPDAWLIQADPLVEARHLAKAPFPTRVADEPAAKNAPWTVNPDFQSSPVSFAVASNTPLKAADTAPVIWTRGLKPDGTWTDENDPKPSPFGSPFGLIMFRDGKVEVFKDNELAANGGALVDYKTRQPTADISKAIHPQANVLESK